MGMKLFMRCAALGVAAAALCPVPSSADAVSDFYRGKTVSVIVGFSPGGGMDLYAHLAADHWGRFLPGKPNFVVQNMPGGGGVKATRYLYSVAARNGTQIALMLPYVVSTMMLRPGDEPVRSEKFHWLGRMAHEVVFAVVRGDAPATTVEGARKHEIAMAATSAQSISATVPYALNALTGTKFKVVKGYRGTSPMALAMERGEVQGAGAMSWTLLDTRLRPSLESGAIKLMYVVSPDRFDKAPDVPAVRELSDDPTAQPVLEFLGNSPAAGRSFIAPPGTPADRVKALRDSFLAMMNDPGFIADAKKRNLEIDPLAGEKVQEIVERVVRTPPEVVKRTREAIKPQ